MKRILFVCTGNTCRSPMAEAILRQKIKWAGIKGVTVRSAGIAASEGHAMSENSRRALRKLGIRGGAFKTRRITDEMRAKSDYVICMTEEHKRAVGGKNAYSIGEITGEGDIADPYGGDESVYLECAYEIERACNLIMEKIIFGEKE